MKLEKLAPLLPTRGVAVFVNGRQVQEHVPLQKYFDMEVKAIDAELYGKSDMDALFHRPVVIVPLVGEEHEA